MSRVNSAPPLQKRPPATGKSPQGKKKAEKDRVNPTVLVRRRLWRRGRRFFIPLTVILCLCFGGLFFFKSLTGDIHDGVAQALGFTVQHVEVEGRVRTSLVNLNNALAVQPGEPLFGYSLTDARQRLLNLHFVHDVILERIWPSTLVVRLMEWNPFAIWQHQGIFSVLDKDGKVLSNITPDQAVLEANRHLPLIVGPFAADKMAALFADLKVFPLVGQRVVAAVRIDQRRWNLFLRSKATVELPSQNVPEALAQLTLLQQKIGLLDRPVEIIDLTVPNRLIIKPYAASLFSGKAPSA